MRFKYSFSNLFDEKKVGHHFFASKCDDGSLLDFAAPIAEPVICHLLEDLKLKRILCANQNHTDHAVIYPSSDGFKYADALITKEPNVGLLIRHADCQAALIYDTKNHVIAAVHAGFRGQVQRIYTKTIKQMNKVYGSLPQDLKIAISPSLGLDHAEFINYKTEFPLELHKYCHEGFMDLKQMALDEVLELGVLKESIDIDPRCTFCEEDQFYSFRKTKTARRMASLIYLKH